MTVAGKVGQVYRCEVCGSEVTLIRRGGAEPTPWCCNRLMVKKHVARMFVCEVCGAEVTAVREGAGHLTPYCCNRLMVRKN